MVENRFILQLIHLSNRYTEWSSNLAHVSTWHKKNQKCRKQIHILLSLTTFIGFRARTIPYKVEVMIAKMIMEIDSMFSGISKSNVLIFMPLCTLFVYGRISGSAGSVGFVTSAFSFPHNSVTVGLILFKLGRCMQ